MEPTTHPIVRFFRYLAVGDRWLALVAGMWIMSCGGLSYTFAVYSPAIKSDLGYDQMQIQALAVAKDIGESVGLIAGLTCDLLPPWAILFIGALHNLVGFGGFWLVLSGYLPPLPFWQMYALLLIGSQGASYFNTSVLVSCVRNFPKSRGSVVGILKGLVGLSGAIFTQVYSALLAPDQKGFLLVVAVFPMIITAIITPFIKPFGADHRKESVPEETSILNIVVGICFFLAAYLLTTMLLQAQFDLSPEVRKFMATGMLIIIILPLVAPMLSYVRLQSKTPDQVPALAPESTSVSISAVPIPPQVPRPTPTVNVPQLASFSPRVRQQFARFDARSPMDADSPTAQSPYMRTPLGESPYSSSPNIYQPNSWNRFASSARPPLHPLSSQQIASTAPLPIPSRRSSNLLVSPGGSPFAFSPFGGYASDDILTVDERERDKQQKKQQDGSHGHQPATPTPTPAAAPSILGVTLTLPLLPHQSRKTQLVQAVSESAVGYLPRHRRRRGPRRGEDFTLGEALVKADFWLLFFGFVCGCGAGLAAINNLAQMGLAQGFTNVDIFVSMVSVWNFCGRLGAGFLSEVLIKEHCLPRPIVLLFADALMAVGHLLLAFALPGSLYVGSLIVGLCYGAHWAIMPATVSELFGLKHFGIVYNTFSIANPLGSYICSSLIAAYFYQKEVGRGGNGGANSLFNSAAAWMQGLSSGSWLPAGSGAVELASTAGNAAEGVSRMLLSDGGDGPDCHGAHCFRTTFLVMMGVCLLGVVLNGALVYRTRVVYISLYGKMRESRKSNLSLQDNGSGDSHETK